MAGLIRRKLRRWVGYAVNQRLATLTCGHQIIIRPRGKTLKYPQSAVCWVCSQRAAVKEPSR
jgi:RNase P protein component